MNHYVITRTTTWRLKGPTWGSAENCVKDHILRGHKEYSPTAEEWSMIEIETGEEGQLSG